MHPSFTKKFSGFVISVAALLLLTSQGFSQVFWTEDFGTGCGSGTLADSIVTTNGMWTVNSSIGFNETYANEWFISAQTNNNGFGNCANDCNGGNNQTLHIGNVAIGTLGLAAEQTGYLNGFYCGSGFCSTTEKRVESPTIDCSGKTGITLEFLYFEGGDPNNLNGDATIWYFDGTSWTLIDPLPKTNNVSCSATFYGLWTIYNFALPISADNNPNVKLGFKWANDETAAGANPSAAFDDIKLSTASLLPPVADFSGNNTTICEGDAVNFTDLSANGPTSWQWTFAGGTPGTSTAQNPTNIVYNTAGVYDVTLVATNVNGNDTELKTGYIIVNACGGIVADFIASDTIICEGDIVDFTDLSTGSPTSWQWQFTGGSPFNSSLQNPSGILYTTAGTYTVSLYAWNASDSDTVVSTNYITVNVCGNPPNANFVASSNNICVNETVDFTDLSTNSPDTWNWTFFGGTPGTSTAQNPTGITYSAPGIYNVKLVVSNANGSDSLLFTNYISVINCVPPVANFIASDTSLCVGDSISFFDLSSNNPTSFQWTFFGATPPVSSSPNPTGIVYNTPGVYTVQLIVENITGSDTLVLTNYINVSACIPPTADFAASQTTICEGFCVDFSDQSTGTPTSWIWLFPGSSNSPTSTAQNPTNVCYQDSGAYNVTLIVQNPYGYDTLVQVAYIHVDTCPKPIVNFMASDTYFCSDNCIDFTDLSANIDPTSIAYWRFPGGVPADTTIEYLAGVPIPVTVCYPDEGIYDVILIEVNQYGSDTLMLSQYISVINVPGAYISNDTAIQFGGSAQLNAGGGISYHWTSQIPGSTFIPSDSVASPIVIPNSNPPEQTYTYYCEITDATTGCKTVKQVTIEILHEDNIFVPNSFKPSGAISAAENATVGVYATNVQSLTFTIYDRWGEKVFESHSACPDKGRCDISGWDGTYKGKDCEPGTYIYTLFLISEGGGIYNKNGNITLVR